MRSLLAAAAVLSIGSALAPAACITDYQKGLEDPRYGEPNALAGQRQPGSSNDYTKTSGEGGGGGDVACVKAGGTLLGDAGSCAVSFKTDVLGAFAAAAPSCSGATCHGGATPPSPPRIVPADSNAMWSEFAAFKLSDGKPYINPCSTDPRQAGIACNVAGTGGCGTHMPPGANLPADAVTKIEAWLKCGSPDN